MKTEMAAKPETEMHGKIHGHEAKATFSAWPEPETERAELLRKIEKRLAREIDFQNVFVDMELLKAAAALLAADSKVDGEPVAWVRRHPDGALTAEFLEDAVIEPVRKKSGAWVPLYTRHQQQAKPLTDEKPSPTAGMNIAQRILHVGGRNNAAGYVEFGSIQAVQALVHQVLRDLPGCAPRATGCPCAMDETAQDAVERKQSDIPAILKDQAS